MKKHKRIFLIIFMIFIFVLPAHADIYMYVDEQGVMHFTNVPTSSRYQLYMKGRGRSQDSGSSTYWSDRYDDLINEASVKYDVPFSLVKAIIKAESNFNHRAVSRAGAMGLMQVIPDNFNLLDIQDPFDPWENIMGGTRYFRLMLDRFSGNLSLALAGYNAGPLRVEQYNGIPPYRETQNYVKKVKKYYRMLRAGD